MSRRRTLLLAAAGGTLGAVAWAALRGRTQRQRRAHAVLEGGPLIIAHRGGAGLAPENTLAAFTAAAASWAVDMIELDVRATADGHCVAIHDPTVDRTTDGTGNVADFTLADLSALDAGFRYTPDEGASFPFRGRGVHIPTIEEIFEAMPPSMRFTIEVKANEAQRPLFDAIERYGIAHRVVAAGMYDRDRTLFHRYRGAISASTEDMKAWMVARRILLEPLMVARFDVVQMPEQANGSRVLTPAVVRALHRRGVPVHVWTINEPEDMERLLDWGVDGLVTDRPDLLGRVLHARNGRSLAPGHDAAPVH